MAPQSTLSLLALDIRFHASHSASNSSPRSHNHSDREPTTLESFSRTIRHYVPSSIPIPTAAPSPPRVSRPVSFGSFLTPSTAPSDPVRDRTDSNDMPDTWKRRGSDAATADPRGRLPWASQQAFRSPDKDQDMPVFNLDDDVSEYGPQEADRRTTRYPGVGDTEEVLWAGWDVLTDGEYAKPRYVSRQPPHVIFGSEDHYAGLF